jgi:hypothetical protein
MQNGLFRRVVWCGRRGQALTCWLVKNIMCKIYRASWLCFLFWAVCYFSARSHCLHHLFIIKMQSRCLSLTPFSSTFNWWRTVYTRMDNVPVKPHEIFFAQIVCFRMYCTWCEKHAGSICTQNTVRVCTAH